MEMDDGFRIVGRFNPMKEAPEVMMRLLVPIRWELGGPQSFTGSRPAVCVITIGNCLVVKLSVL
jgi:hypothetical protein